MFLIFVWENVPRAMISLLPLLAPKEWNCLGTKPESDRYSAAGLFRTIDPAGLIKSQVMSFPNFKRQRMFFKGSVVVSKTISCKIKVLFLEYLWINDFSIKSKKFENQKDTEDKIKSILMKVTAKLPWILFHTELN